jgi:hypothetical protein
MDYWSTALWAGILYKPCFLNLRHRMLRSHYKKFSPLNLDHSKQQVGIKQNSALRQGLRSKTSAALGAL